MGFFNNLGIDVNDYEPNTQAILKYLDQIATTLNGLALKQGVSTAPTSSSAGAVPVQTQSYNSHLFLTLPLPITTTPETYILQKPADAVIFSANVDVQVEFDTDVSSTTPILSAFQEMALDMKVINKITYRMPQEFVDAVLISAPKTPVFDIKGTAAVMLFYY